jgi:hypothetical protein
MTSLTLTPVLRRHPQPTAHQIDIVVPVHNEQDGLEQSIRRLHRFLESEFPFSWRIVVADNASTDATPAIADRLAYELSRVDVAHLERKGRGRALRAAWTASQAQVVCYMDVDLSTDLRALLPLVAPLLSGHSDLAIGTRLAHGARVVRGPKRELISRAYNRLLHTRCGPASATRSAASRLPAPMRCAGCSSTSTTTAGSSTPSCSCSPSGAACASTRFRSTGSTTPTRAWTSFAPHCRTCAASPA